jgi:phosphatidylglycerol:prolipoprotein diacylglycerol transferase
VKPILFELPVIGRVDSYMTLLIIGFTLAIWLGRRAEDRTGRNGDRVVDLGILMLVFGIAGARILSVLADGHFHDFVNICTDPTLVEPADQYARGVVCTTDAMCNPGGREIHYLCDLATKSCHPPRDCLAALKFWNGGLAYYGGFLIAVPVGLWYARRKKLGVLRIADLTSPLIAFGLFFGRMGCFYNGCCYGSHTGVPWAVSFPRGPHHVHPTQLYEAAGALAIFAVLHLVVTPRKRAHGQVFAGLLVLYGLLRFGLEFLRADERGGFGGLSTSQWIGIPLVLAGSWLFWTLPRRRRATPASSPDTPPAPQT